MFDEKLRLLGLILLLLFIGNIPQALAQEESIPQNLHSFVDVTKQAGINFTHNFGDKELSSILEATGSGCAFLDYDQDDYMDIYIVNGGYSPDLNSQYPVGHDPRKEIQAKLYHNNGNGNFTDVTEKAGVGNIGGYGTGVVVGDYNNDGYPDIFVCNYGPNVLYRNNGDGTFTDVTQQAGVTGPKELNGFIKWSIHACFLDYDKDGFLDLYVGNYLTFDPKYRYFFAPTGFPGPLDYRGQPDILYHNNGNGTFTDVTKKAGVYNTEGRAMSVSAADYNNDGWPDVYVSNDAMERYLYRNNKNSTFTNVALEEGVAYGEFGEATSAMGSEFADFDNDGYLDLFVTDMGYCALYRNNGLTFDELTSEAGIAEICGQPTGWGLAVFDYDNDGYQDIFITNGDAHHLYPEVSLLFRNGGNWKFEDVSLKTGDYFGQREFVGRGATYGDFDNDGNVDILVNNLGGPALLLHNNGGSQNHWLTVRTIGTKSNRDGIGVRLKIIAGTFSEIAEVKAGSGYLCSADPRVHFGLGKNTKVDLLEIRWPSGIVQTLKDVKVDQILVVKESSAP